MSDFGSLATKGLTCLIVIGCCTGISFGASTINAISCSQNDVQSAVNSASTGDVVVIPPGTCTWTNQLIISVGITLQGQGVGQTIIRDNVPTNNANSAFSPLISWTCVTNAGHRLTGIEFQDGGRQPVETNGIIRFRCVNIGATTVRVDHNKFDHLNGDMLTLNTTVGVTDHNIFLSRPNNIPIVIRDSNWNGTLGQDGSGDFSWSGQNPVSWGSPQFMFVEDNTITYDPGTEYICNDGFSGARAVFRFNVTSGCNFEVHGTESSNRQRGSRAVEIYRNTINGVNQTNILADIRSGTALIWGNAGTNLQTPARTAKLDDFRTINNFAPFGGADGQSPWDINDPANPYGSYTVTSTPGSLQVGVATANWIPNQWVGFALKKTSPCPSTNCFALITGNTSNTISYLSSSVNGFGADILISVNDTFNINRVLTTLDQPGRGGGTLLSGAVPSVPGSWNDQYNEPLYQWLNTGNGINVPFGANASCSTCRPNEHFYDYTPSFNGTSGVGSGPGGAKPGACNTGVAYWATDEGSWNTSGNGGQGNLYKCIAPSVWNLAYTPYTYPHPLIALGGGGTGGTGGGTSGGGASGTLATQTTLTVSTSSVSFGTSQTFTATVVLASDGTTPVSTGSVSFSTGVTLPLNASGKVQINATLSSGNQSIRATYNGDGGAHAGSSATASVTIGKAVLVITPNGAKSKTYGQNFTAFDGTVSGLLPGDAGTPTFSSTGGPVGAASGIYDIVATGFNFTTGKASNYDFTLNTATGGLTVNKANLTVTPAGGKTKQYGQAFSAFTSLVVGLQGNDAGTVSYSSLGADAAVLPGSYDIVASAFNLTSGSATNYNISLNTAAQGLTVTKAVLSVTADAKTIVYPAQVPAFTATITGFVNGDTAAVVTGAPALTSNVISANGVPNAGAWQITPTVTNMSAVNYTFTPVPGPLVVNKAPLTVTADSLNIAAGVNPVYTYTITGFVNGDPPSVVTGTPSFTNNAKVSNGFPAAGSWVIVVSTGTLAATNYTFNFAPGILVVGPFSGPQVTFVSPTDKSTVSGTVLVSVTVASTNAIANVQFSVDAVTNLGTAVTAGPAVAGVQLVSRSSPTVGSRAANGNTYSINWNTAQTPNGSHALIATVVDNTNQTTSIPITVNVSNTAPSTGGSLSTGAGLSFVTTDSIASNLVNVSHALITSANQTPLSGLAGVALIDLRTNGVLVTEAGVPASPEMLAGRIYAEIHGVVNTGIALANENTSDASISYYFTDSSGRNVSPGVINLPAGHQIAAFLNQAPFFGPIDIQGSFTFVSSVPVGAVALRGLTNERSEFLITTVPVASLSTITGPAILPHFADGGGWSTQVVLTNNSDDPRAGTIQFFDPGSVTLPGQPLTMTVNGASGSQFSYAIPPHGSSTFATSGTGPTMQVGWVQITATQNTASDSTSVPSAVSIFAYRNNKGITVSDASVMAQPTGTSFGVYVEASGVPAQPGSLQSGVAIANPSPTAALVRLELAKLDGTSVGLTQTISIPGNGQIAQFINQLFPQLPTQFQGIILVTSGSPVGVAALRGRYNERNDFLITTTPPLNADTLTSGDLVLPHIVSGMGYSTQIVMFGQTGSVGQIFLLDQNGHIRPASALAPQ